MLQRLSKNRQQRDTEKDGWTQPDGDMETEAKDSSSRVEW